MHVTMGRVTREKDGLFGSVHMLAVPFSNNLLGPIKLNQTFAQKTFPMAHTPEFIDGIRGIIVSADDVAELTVTASKQPHFDPNIYDVSRTPNLEGNTTLQIGVFSTSKELADVLDKGVQLLFNKPIELEYRALYPA